MAAILSPNVSSSIRSRRLGVHDSLNSRKSGAATAVANGSPPTARIAGSPMPSAFPRSALATAAAAAKATAVAAPAAVAAMAFPTPPLMRAAVAASPVSPSSPSSPVARLQCDKFLPPCNNSPPKVLLCAAAAPARRPVASRKVQVRIAARSAAPAGLTPFPCLEEAAAAAAGGLAAAPPAWTDVPFRGLMDGNVGEVEVATPFQMTVDWQPASPLDLLSLAMPMPASVFAVSASPSSLLADQEFVPEQAVEAAPATAAAAAAEADATNIFTPVYATALTAATTTSSSQAPAADATSFPALPPRRSPGVPPRRLRSRSRRRTATTPAAAEAAMEASGKQLGGTLAAEKISSQQGAGPEAELARTEALSQEGRSDAGLAAVGEASGAAADVCATYPQTATSGHIVALSVACPSSRQPSTQPRKSLLQICAIAAAGTSSPSSCEALRPSPGLSPHVVAGVPFHPVEETLAAGSNPFLLRDLKAIHKIGAGSFGQVFKGMDPASGRVKAFKFADISSGEGLMQTVTEYTCSQQLCASRCPNVLVAEAVEEDEERAEACLVMPFCSGGDLRQYVEKRAKELKERAGVGTSGQGTGLKGVGLAAVGASRARVRSKKGHNGGSGDGGSGVGGVGGRGGLRRRRLNGGLPEPEAVAIFSQLVLAVSGVHSLGICHMDIKPDNVLLVKPPRKVAGSHAVVIEEGCVKLTDFGLALDNSLPDHLKREWMGGTGPFMAPEVFKSLSGVEGEGASVGLEADMWSLGATLYFLLSGRLPYMDVRAKEGGEVNQYSATMEGNDSFLLLEHPAWRGVSVHAKSLVRRLLSFDKGARPTADEVLGHPLLRGGRRCHQASEASWRPAWQY